MTGTAGTFPGAREYAFRSLRSALFALALFFNPSAIPDAHAQPSLGFFRATLQNDAVLLEWQIVAGNLCNGITIQRASNREPFTRIGAIDGICGSISEATLYAFVDTAPGSNGHFRYRLELGSGTFSEEVTVEIVDLGDRSYAVKPSPVSGEATLHFDNPAGQEHAISVYSLNGLLVHAARTHQDRFELAAHAFAPGIYLFVITDGNRVLPGRFLVAR